MAPFRFFIPPLTAMVIAPLLTLSALPVSLQAANTDADPHAHHRMMMQNQDSYARSEHHYQVPDLEMLDQSGKVVSLKTLLERDQPVVLNFIFTTCPTVCPVLSATFSQVQQQMSDANALMVSISIDPEYDVPEQLQEYATRYSAQNHWQFITGTLKQSVAVQKAFDIYRGNKMNHVPATFLRAGPDAPWVRLEGFTSSDELLHEYHQVMN